jgi:hypothetical protein
MNNIDISQVFEHICHNHQLERIIITHKNIQFYEWFKANNSLKLIYVILSIICLYNYFILAFRNYLVDLLLVRDNLISISNWEKGADITK